MLEKTSKIMESKHYHYTATSTTKPQPQAPYLRIFWTVPGIAIQPIPWADCSSVDHTFSQVIFPNIQSKHPLAEGLRPFLLTLFLPGRRYSLQPPLRQLQRVMRCPLSLLFLKLNNPQLLLVRLVLLTLLQLCCHSLDAPSCSEQG